MEITKNLKIYNSNIAKIDEGIKALQEQKKEQLELREQELARISELMEKDGIDSKTEGNLKLEMKVSKTFDKNAFEEKFNPESEAYRQFCDAVEHEAVPAWTEYKFKIPNVKKVDPELHKAFVVETKQLKIKEVE